MLYPLVHFSKYSFNAKYMPYSRYILLNKIPCLNGTYLNRKKLAKYMLNDVKCQGGKINLRPGQ